MVLGVVVVSMGERVAGMREGRGREGRTGTGPAIAPKTFPRRNPVSTPLPTSRIVSYCPPFCRWHTTLTSTMVPAVSVHSFTRGVAAVPLL